MENIFCSLQYKEPTKISTEQNKIKKKLTAETQTNWKTFFIIYFLTLWFGFKNLEFIYNFWLFVKITVTVFFYYYFLLFIRGENPGKIEMKENCVFSSVWHLDTHTDSNMYERWIKSTQKTRTLLNESQSVFFNVTLFIPALNFHCFMNELTMASTHLWYTIDDDTYN